MSHEIPIVVGCKSPFFQPHHPFSTPGTQPDQRCLRSPATQPVTSPQSRNDIKYYKIDQWESLEFVTGYIYNIYIYYI